jgi:uncharacterized protein YegL
MGINRYDAETPLNAEMKLPVVLLLDVSGSMSGRIDAVNQGLGVFESVVMGDATSRARADLAVVTFGGSVGVLRDFGLLIQGALPTNLVATGGTPLVDAARTAIKMLKDRIDWYAKAGTTCYRPFLIIISDGEPDPGQDVAGLEAELQQLVTQGYDTPLNPGHPRKFNCMTFGVGGAVALDKLAAFSPTAPQAFEVQDFKELFKYLGTLTKALSTSRPSEKLGVKPADLGCKPNLLSTGIES